jgi:hypothetical protein
MHREMARKLVVETMHGSVAMARETDTHPAKLREGITSPGARRLQRRCTHGPAGMPPFIDAGPPAWPPSCQEAPLRPHCTPASVGTCAPSLAMQCGRRIGERLVPQRFLLPRGGHGSTALGVSGPTHRRSLEMGGQDSNIGPGRAKTPREAVISHEGIREFLETLSKEMKAKG